MESRPPTLKDLARVLRVHHTTVSRALRGHPSIPAATCERIRRAATRLGYTANPVFAALTRARVRVQERGGFPRIAFLVNRSPEMGFGRLDHYRRFLTGARRQAKALGYDLELLFLTEDYHDASSLDAYLKAKQISGIVIGAFEPGLARLTLDWDQYAVVKIDSQHLAPGVTLVSADQLQIVRLAFRHMRARGYRRIGLAVGRADEDGTNQRHAEGYLVEQSALPPADHVPALLFPYNATTATVAGQLGRWIRRHRIEAVLCNWGNIDKLLAMAGLRVPRDIACACTCLGRATKGVAGVEAFLETVGAKAVSALAVQLKADERGTAKFPSTTYVQGQWRDGASAPERIPHRD